MSGRKYRRWGTVIAVVALLGDAVLMTASVLHRIVSPEGTLGFLALGRWNGNRDGTFVELWGGLQLVLAACALLSVAVLGRRRARGHHGEERRSTVYIAWGLVLITIAADDYLMLHERVGSFLDEFLALPDGFGLRGQDFGELLVWALLAAVLGLCLLVGHLHADPRGRRDSLVLLALTFFLAMSGVVLDMLNVALHDVVGEQSRLMTMHLETGGELVAMTFLLMWSLHVLTRERTTYAGVMEAEGETISVVSAKRNASAAT